MILRLLLLAVFTCHLSFTNIYANDSSPKSPKIGLVLSGGGAKGLVYIPLLKAIDSLGLKIDYINGTSMGALIGGLYSIGYSGKELDSIGRNIDWNKYLNDELSMNKINMEEKDEYKRYLYEFKSNNIVPTLPMGLIEGQNIMRLLNDLTFNAQHIQDFSQFKIPFVCYSADVVKGVPVEIKEGSLALALRSTMAIPTVFSPVDTNGMLLVDGGILKNFPVEDMKRMGADYIIGANSSGYSLKKKDLKTLFKIFEQMLNVTTTEDYQKQKDLCDLLIDYSYALKEEGFGSSSFNDANKIIDLGERVVNNFIPFLAELAEQQKKYSTDSTLTNDNWREENTIDLEQFQVNIDNDEYKTIIKNKIEFEDPNHATMYEINRAVDRIYGTRFFDRVYYYMDYQKDSLQPNLIFKASGAKKFAYKFGLHYDQELSAGITVNLTYRNIGKFSSRSLISLDISNNPKVRAGYQVYFGNSGWWMNTEHFFGSVNQISYDRRKALGAYYHLYSRDNFSFNWTIGQNNLISFGSEFEFRNRKAVIKAKDRGSYIMDSMLSKSPYYNVNFFLKLERNTLDKPFFPNKGILAKSTLKYVPWGNGYIGVYSNEKDPVTKDIINNYETIRPEFSAYGKLHLQFEQYIPLHKLFILHYRMDAGFMFVSHGLNGRSFDFAIQDGFQLGGIDSRERERVDDFIPFWGNREGFTQSYNFASLAVEGQIIPVKDIYILPRISVLAYDDGNSSVYGKDPIYINQLKSNIEWAWSGGLAVAYNSMIGPIKVSVSKASNTERWFFYVALGYRF
ncbi:MAG TPA: patatin-like phospholipase family protein [Chitinophagales bacterium]|nr:patatin-like phospholipase family protein [Chitinophagales bacterium]